MANCGLPIDIVEMVYKLQKSRCGTPAISQGDASAGTFGSAHLEALGD